MKLIILCIHNVYMSQSARFLIRFCLINFPIEQASLQLILLVSILLLVIISKYTVCYW